MANEKIQDFGQKIGGAKKDLWKTRGMQLDDLEYMNKAECDKYIKKDNIWPKPDYAKMLNEEGYSRNALYFIKTLRDAIPTKPELYYSDNEDRIREKQEQYIEFINEFKTRALEVKTDKDIDKLGFSYFQEKGFVEKGGYSWSVTDKAKAFLSDKLFKAIQSSSSTIEREATRKGFLGDEPMAILQDYKAITIDGDKVTFGTKMGKACLTVKEGFGSEYYYYPRQEELKNPELYKPGNIVVENLGDIEFVGTPEKVKLFYEELAKTLTQNKENSVKEKAETKERKKALIPPQLAHIKRDGPTVRDKDIEGDDFIKDFGIKGGEFGNWLNENDRQTNMNMAYDSFKDMAKVLNIKDTDIAMNGKLNIAFGSRGVKGAAAHYEPLREVINLTKMNGAGSLAHEYFHAMDNMTGKAIGARGFATESREPIFRELVEALKYKEVRDETAIRERYEPKIQKYEKDHSNLIKQLDDYIKKVLPDEKLTPEQITKRDKIFAQMLENPAEWDFRKFKSNECDELNKLSKEATGRVLSADVKKTIPNWQYYIHSYKDSANNLREEMQKEIKNGEAIRVETDFYKSAKKLDTLFAKSTHGYWQSDIEMAARAFECYVSDKLAEQGIRNDYLVGHYNAGYGSEYSAYPSKEERQAMNKVFDKVIEKMKELGIVHNRQEPMKEQHKQKPKNKDMER